MTNEAKRNECPLQPLMVGLSDFPYLKTAIETDGAIRLADGRWSRGFVNDEQLNKCIAMGLLVVERRHGMRFAVKPNAEAESSARSEV